MLGVWWLREVDLSDSAREAREAKIEFLNAGGNKIDDVTGVVLCGGRSKRMGTDKVVLPFNGRALLDHTVQKMQSVFSNVLLSVRHSSPSENAGLPVVRDMLAGDTPLSGIHAALRYLGLGRIMVVAVDMPLVSEDLLKLMCTVDPKADVVVPRIQGHLEPLLAVYSVRCAPFIEKYVERGDRKVISFFKEVSVRVLQQDEVKTADPKLRSFINVNSKAELRAMEFLSQAKVI